MYPSTICLRSPSGKCECNPARSSDTCRCSSSNHLAYSMSNMAAPTIVRITTTTKINTPLLLCLNYQKIDVFFTFSGIFLSNNHSFLKLFKADFTPKDSKKLKKLSIKCSMKNSYKHTHKKAFYMYFLFLLFYILMSFIPTLNILNNYPKKSH